MIDYKHNQITALGEGYKAMKTKIKNAVKKFKKSRFLLGIVCLVIGATAMYLWLEGREYYEWVREGLSYTHREISIKGVGASAKAEAQDTPQEEKEAVLPSPKEEGVAPVIRRVAQQEKFDDADLLVRIAQAESGLRPYKDNDVKTSTAAGLFQFTRGTWKDGCRWFNRNWTLNDRYDPTKSTKMAIWFIKRGELHRWDASRNNWEL